MQYTKCAEKHRKLFRSWKVRDCPFQEQKKVKFIREPLEDKV